MEQLKNKNTDVGTTHQEDLSAVIGRISVQIEKHSEAYDESVNLLDRVRIKTLLFKQKACAIDGSREETFTDLMALIVINIIKITF